LSAPVSTSTEIVVAGDAAALAVQAAARIAEVLRAAVAARGRSSVALAGGRTPRQTYRSLAAMPGLPWEWVHVYFSDERCVPPDHADSNYRMAKETLLGVVSVPEGQVHRIRGEAGAAAAASEYDALLRGGDFAAAAPGGPPRMDLVLLGLGPDGHVASLFPGHAALDEASRWAVPVEGPGISPARVTLTLPVVNAAAEVIVLVSGAAKSKVVLQVLGSARSSLPAARVQPAGRLVWLLDLAASGAGGPPP
jgi:6-phosphogluconolactonase